MDKRDRRDYFSSYIVTVNDHTITLRLDNEAMEVPCRRIVCPKCDGRGRYVKPSIDSRGVTPGEFRRDPGFRESYFRGDYDVPCDVCGGDNVIARPVRKRLGERVSHFLARIEQEIRARREHDEMSRRERENLRRMNGGLL